MYGREVKASFDDGCAQSLAQDSGRRIDNGSLRICTREPRMGSFTDATIPTGRSRHQSSSQEGSVYALSKENGGKTEKFCACSKVVLGRWAT